MKLVLRISLILFFVASTDAAYIYYPQYADKISEFIARRVDAKLEKILVSGTQNINPQTLLSSISLTKGDSLIGFNAAAVRTQLQKLDWVKEAVVERQLPSTLKISIYEYTPIARLENKSGLWLVDSDGHEITQIQKTEFKYLPLLHGENAAKQAAALFGLLMSQNIKLGTDVVEARYIGERRWDIAFNSGVWVQLPENDPETALYVLKKLDDKKEVLSMKGGVIDLRLDDRIVLRLPKNRKITERVL